ncbi:MAG TPA: pantoate--beta-alanine ligase [Anaerolineales bacterium]|nr:pantoate--beta-alanine ligase [Anaerolineales bacterium]
MGVEGEGIYPMITITELSDLRAARASLPEPLGLVPTMGYLHEGHLSLVRRAKDESASVAVTIFVNPTQFGPKEDLSAYPRDLGRDLTLLEAAGVGLAWTPTEEIMYPPGFQTEINLNRVAAMLEGSMRPGHFTGVATVVAKLFNAVRPQKAYFGQKDAQQTVVIRRMVKDLNFPVEIVVCQTVREIDGLALSSRNVYLNREERKAATVIHRALRAADERFRSGERQAEALLQAAEDVLGAEPLAQPQYVSCADPESLEELSGPVERALLSMAVFIGKTRLIDNMILG